MLTKICWKILFFIWLWIPILIVGCQQLNFSLNLLWRSRSTQPEICKRRTKGFFAARWNVVPKANRRRVITRCAWLIVGGRQRERYSFTLGNVPGKIFQPQPAPLYCARMQLRVFWMWLDPTSRNSFQSRLESRHVKGLATRKMKLFQFLDEK